MSKARESEVFEVVRGRLLVLVWGRGSGPQLLLLALSPDTNLRKKWARLCQGMKGNKGMDRLRWGCR